MRRILHVNTFGQVRGGAENYIRETAAALSDFTHGLLFLRDPDAGYLNSFSSSAQTESLSAAPALEVLRQFAPDLILLHNHPGESIAPFLAYRSQTGAPVAKVFHDYSMVYTGTGYNRLTLRRSRDPIGWHSLPGALTRDAFSRRFVFDNPWRKKRLLAEINAVDAVETHTVDMRHTLERNGIRAPRYFLNPVWGPDIDARSEAPVKDERSFIFLGNLIRGKGLQLLFKSLRRLHVPYRLRVIGDGYQRAPLEEYARRCRLNVEFLGRLPKTETGSHLDRAQFLVAPSVFEPFGYVLVEAMAHGLPVVAFNLAGPAEIIVEAQTGFLVPTFDLKMLADRISKLLDDPLLCRELGKNGRSRMLSLYTRSAHMDLTLKMLRELGI